MADERDFQLLDDYLTNRMSEQERSAFEQRLQADPDLRNEYVLQQRLVKVIKDTRVAELKSMLNKVPVSATAEKTLASKIVLGAVLSILLATAVYWYLREDKVEMAQPQAPVQEKTLQEQPVTPQPEAQTPAPQEETVVKPPVAKEKNQTSAGTEQSKPSQARKPSPLSAPQEKVNGDASRQEPVLDVFDPAQDTPDATIQDTNKPEVLRSKSPSLVVETDTENKKYTFHYQFKEGKVFLYGPFERNLYEIMEFFSGDQRTVFLYYDDKYFLLDEKSGDQVQRLTTITDPALLQKLKEYRAAK